MRILYIFRSLAVWGGIERVLVEKMNHLYTMYGYDVFMLTTEQGNHPVPYQLEDAIHLEDLGIQFHKQYQYHGIRRLWEAYKRSCLFEKRLFAQINIICPDIIVCTTSDPVNSIAKVKGGIPLIVESHSVFSRTFGERGIRKRYVDYLLGRGIKKANCVITLTISDAIEWRKVYQHVDVIPNIVHLNKGLISSQNNKRVLFVGRFDYQKRVSEIIEIWRMLQTDFPDWELHIYGDGDQRKELLKAVHEHRDSIIIHKPTSSIFDCYINSAFLVMTSLFEPFGLVMPEAMSCGLPVISYDVPYGPASIIAEGIDGFLIKNNDRKAFADKMALLMRNIELRQQMGKQAVLSAQRYSADNIMPMWKKLFEELYVSSSNY